ncbi:zinc ribbon domain-containing protein, partial [Frigoribacterium faeni]
ASYEHQALLLDLQQLDTALRQIAHKGANLPEIAVLASLEGDGSRLRSRLATEQGAWEDAQSELKRIESDVAVVEARVVRDEQRIASSSSSKDVAALEGELAALAKRRSDLEDLQLEVMERVESLGAVAAVTRGELDQLDTRRIDAETGRDAKLAELEADRAEVVANRETIAATVPADLLALYERQRDRYGVGASLLRGGVSSASGVALTGSDLAAVRAAAEDDVVLCPDSNAVLVRTYESGL